MPRVPFVGTVTGSDDDLLTPFLMDDNDVSADSVGNEVLFNIDDNDLENADFGITLPPTNKAYHVTRITMSSSVADKDVQIALADSIAVSPLIIEPFGMVQDGNGELLTDIIVPAGWQLLLRYVAANGDAILSGEVEWEGVA